MGPEPCRRTSTTGQALCCHAAVPQHLSGSRRWGAPLEGRAGGRKPLLLRASSEGNAGLAKITGRRRDEKKINSLSTCPEHKSSSLCYTLLLGALTESAQRAEAARALNPHPIWGAAPVQSPQQRRGLRLSSSGRAQQIVPGHISLAQPRLSRWPGGSPRHEPSLSHAAHEVSSPLRVPLLPHMHPGGRKQIFPIKTNHYALIHPSFGSSRCSWPAAGPSPSSAPRAPGEMRTPSSRPTCPGEEIFFPGGHRLC